MDDLKRLYARSWVTFLLTGFALLCFAYDRAENLRLRQSQVQTTISVDN